MFSFKNRNKKPDSKVRFQHGQFAKKLDQQRNFKRKARFVPFHGFDKALSYVGLGSRIKQLLALVLLGFVVYIIYIPNFLTLKSITVTGLNDDSRNNIEYRIWDLINKAPFYSPQKNILVLNKARISDALMKDKGIYKVNDVSKNYRTKSLSVDLTPRTERFLVYTSERVYDVYNDGYLKGEAGVSVEQWSSLNAPNMLKVALPGNIEPGNLFVFDKDWVDKFGLIDSILQQRKLPKLTSINFGKTNSRTDESGKEIILKLDLPFKPQELNLELQMLEGNYFKVILDPRVDIEKQLNRLDVIIKQSQPDRLAKLFYIDVRLEERGYVCLAGAPCANN